VSAEVSLSRGILKSFVKPTDVGISVDGGWIGGEDSDSVCDGSAVELVNLDTGFSPNSSLWDQTLLRFKQYLTFPDRPYSFRRRQTGDWYDLQEWIFIDIRVARTERVRRLVDHHNHNHHYHHSITGESCPSQTTIKATTETTTEEWILAQAQANAMVLPELIDGDGKYAGAIPMVGFGAGAWIELQHTC